MEDLLMNDNQNQPPQGQPVDPNQQPQQPYYPPQQGQPYPPQNPQAQYQPPYPQQPPQKKKGKGCLIAVIVVVVLLVAIVAISGGGSKDSNTSKPASEPANLSDISEIDSASVATETPATTGEGTVGDQYIKIVGAEYATDYQGNKCVVVTYEWTNNSDEGTSFFVAVNAKVFQNGIQSDYAVVSGLDSKDTTEIKPGATLTVQKAYALQDETSPIEVECEELFNFGDEVITTTYPQPLS